MSQQKERIMNARFYVYVNKDWCKLTLKKEQKVEIRRGGPTEEGYYAFADIYEFDGDHVHHEHHYYAKDCDGPFEKHSYYICPVSDLKKLEPEEIEFDGCTLSLPARPDWQEVSSYQRDIYAEMMGY